jgi:hypothetical protein
VRRELIDLLIELVDPMSWAQRTSAPTVGKTRAYDRPVIRLGGGPTSWDS